MKDERHIYIYRRKDRTDDYTRGKCITLNGLGDIVFSSFALERGWLNNKKNISCVPAKTFDIVKEYSPKFRRKLWEIKGVKGRSECKIHEENFAKNLEGCISLGFRFADIDGDGILDITNSRNTINLFDKMMGKITKAKITFIDL